MSIPCKTLVELVTEYLEGTLSPDERALFDEHLVECGGCRNYLAQMRETIQITGMLSEADISPEAENELLRVFRDWKANPKAQD